MKKKVTKKALWASGLSIVVCLAMLISATFAWFSDVASNKGNVITSGNLAISVIGYNAAGGDPVNFKDDHDPIINEINWEPGLSNTKFVKIENIGTLGLKYELTFVTYDQGLQEALWYKVTQVDELYGGNPPAFEERKQMGLISGDVQKGELDESESVIYRIDYGMNESAGNTYMDKSFSADIIVTATQTNDKAKVVKAYTVNDIETAERNDTVVFMKDITLDKDLTINNNINLDTNGYTLNLGGFSLTFGQTTYYATYDIKGVFKNGIIILDNSNGHFNMTGDAGTDANIVVENTYESSAVLSGQWGNVNVNDTKGRTYIEGSVGNINAGAGSTVIIRGGAAIGGVSGDGDVLDEEGMPYGAIVLEEGDNIGAAVMNADSGAILYLKAGTYSGVAVLNTPFNKKITLVGESRDSVFLEYLAFGGSNVAATTEFIVKNVTFTGNYTGSTKSTIFVQTGTLRLNNCFFGNIPKINPQQRTIESSSGTNIYVNACVFDNTTVNSYFNGKSLKSFTNNVFKNNAKGIAGDSMQAAFMETVFTGNDFNFNSFYYDASSLVYEDTSFEQVVDEITQDERDFMTAALKNNTNLLIRFALNGGSYYATLDEKDEFVQA